MSTENCVWKLKQNIDISSNEIIGSQVTVCGDCEDFDISDKYFVFESKVLAEQ
jgi:hypothetical protein